MNDETPALTMTRLFKAPRDLLFRMWSDPQHMKQWGCPTGFTVVYSTIDFRVGGTWRSCMRAPDGSEHRLRGQYLDIVPNERIVNTSAWLDENDNPVQESVITLTFKSIGDDTELTLHQAPFESVASRDSHRHGWIASLNNLDAYVEAFEAAAQTRGQA